MRRFLFGVVIASVTAAPPAWAFGGDREIAQSVMAELQQHKAAGTLKGFDIDLKVEDGVVYLTGEVANRAHRAIVEQAAINEVGQAKLVNKLRIKGDSPASETAVGPLRVLPASPLKESGPAALPMTRPTVVMPVPRVNGEGSAALPLTRPTVVMPVSPVNEVSPPVSPVAQKEPVASRSRVEEESPAALPTTRPTVVMPVSRVKEETVTAQPVMSSEAVTPASRAKEESPVALPATRPTAVMSVSNMQDNREPTVSDAAITNAVIAQLQQSKATGALRDFSLDVSTINGDVWMKGSVATESQRSHVLDVARRTRGVSRVIDDLTVVESRAIRQVSTSVPTPIPHASSTPSVGQPMSAHSGLATYNTGGGYVSGAPVPMQVVGGQYGVGAPRYDQPNMPSYAWPSYAAHPNYAAVTYPKQYSPSAWPYIGPFYPYPQVPLGWRKVALEWDDGLWYLDFTSK